MFSETRLGRKNKDLMYSVLSSALRLQHVLALYVLLALFILYLLGYVMPHDCILTSQTVQVAIPRVSRLQWRVTNDVEKSSKDR